MLVMVMSEAYHNWDDFTGSRGTVKDTYVINGLGTNTSALTVSPFNTQSSILYVGSDAGQLYKVSNANNPNNQQKVQITGTVLLVVFLILNLEKTKITFLLHSTITV